MWPRGAMWRLAASGSEHREDGTLQCVAQPMLGAPARFPPRSRAYPCARLRRSSISNLFVTVCYNLNGVRREFSEVQKIQKILAWFFTTYPAF